MLRRENDNQIGGNAVEKLVVNGRTVIPITMQEIVYKSRNVKVPAWAVKVQIYMLGGGGNGTNGGLLSKGRGGTSGEWHRVTLNGLHGGEIIVTVGIAGEKTRIRYYDIFSEAQAGIHGGNGTHTGIGAQTWAHTRGVMTTHPAGSRKRYILRGSNSCVLPGENSKGFGGGGAGGNPFYQTGGKGSSGACYLFFSNTP